MKHLNPAEKSGFRGYLRRVFGSKRKYSAESIADFRGNQDQIPQGNWFARILGMHDSVELPYAEYRGNPSDSRFGTLSDGTGRLDIEIDAWSVYTAYIEALRKRGAYEGRAVRLEKPVIAFNPNYKQPFLMEFEEVEDVKLPRY